MTFFVPLVPGAARWRTELRKGRDAVKFDLIEDGPIDLRVEFVLPPGGKLVDRPGVLTCVEAVVDALAGTAFGHASQVVALAATKRFIVDGEASTDRPGVLVHVWPADKPSEAPKA